MEYGYDSLTALSIIVIGGFILRNLPYIKERKAEKEYKVCERNERDTKNLSKILKDKDKNIKF